MTDVNLLPVEAREQEEFQSLRKKISVASVVILALTAVFTLAILFFFTMLAAKRTTLISQVEDSARTIDSLKPTEELVVVAKDKASVANDILSSRADYFSTFNNFGRLIPQGVYFTDIKFNQGKIVMSGKAKSSAEVAGLISSLLSPDGAKIVSGVTVDSLSADEEGVYSFSINAQVVRK